VPAVGANTSIKFHRENPISEGRAYRWWGAGCAPEGGANTNLPPVVRPPFKFLPTDQLAHRSVEALLAMLLAKVPNVCKHVLYILLFEPEFPCRHHTPTLMDYRPEILI
jgi:hypothetical protein